MAKIVDLSRLLKGISSGWVAISADYKRMVAKGRNLKAVRNKVKEMPTGSVYLMPVVENYRNIVTRAR